MTRYSIAHAIQNHILLFFYREICHRSSYGLKLWYSAVMFEGLFGNSVVEKILFALYVYDEGYGRGMAKAYDEPVNRFQQQLKRLENGEIIVCRLIGRVRIYSLNLRYPFLKELRSLIERAYEFLPEKEKLTYCQNAHGHVERANLCEN